MNSLSKSAIAVLIASIAAMIWGFQYRSEHPFVGAAAFFGYSDPTYSLAGWAAGLGVIAFLVGIALLIAGLVQPSSSGSSASAAAPFVPMTAPAAMQPRSLANAYVRCAQCNSENDLGGRFCNNCGNALAADTK